MANAVFEDVQTRFLGSLPPRERKLFEHCSSPEQMVAETSKLGVIADDRIRGTKLIGKVKGFTEKIKPYFEIIAIVVQSNPEYAAIAWGAVRLVLQLASNFTTFFEKLVNTLERLAHSLPQYDLILELCKTLPSDQLTDRIKDSVRKFYEHLFNFLQSVARIFTKKDSSGPKSSVVVTAKLFWQPFDSRFGELLDQMTHHSSIVQDELRLADMRAGAEERALEAHARKLSSDERVAADMARNAAAEEQRRAELERLLAADAREEIKRTRKTVDAMNRYFQQKDAEERVNRIRNWLDPPNFADIRDRTISQREDGTGGWFLDEALFKRWSNFAAQRLSTSLLGDVLWIRGNPGCGKTVLAASTLEAFKNDERFQDTNTCYYFFHTESGSTAPEPALRAILSQVLHTNRHNEALMDMFVLAMDTNTEGQKNASVSDLRDMFGLCWANVGNYYILLDGLDEVVTPAFDNMLSSALVQTLSYSNVKTLMLSRPAGLAIEWISHAVPNDRRFDVGNSNTNDIQLYLSRQITYLLSRNLLPTNVNPQQLVGHLVTGANGMFLWARLMCKLLNSRMFSPAQRTDLIMTVTLPEELSSMYERIFHLILQMPEIESNLAKDVLQWLTFSCYMLNARELWQALTSTEAKYKPPGDPVTDDIGDFRELVLMVCASLVEFRERSVESEEGSFHLVHLSIKEYIIQCATEHDQPRSRWPRGTSLQFRKSQCHTDMTRSCLYFLTYHLPPQPLGGSIGRDVKRGDLSRAFPFCRYSIQNWHIHLCKAFESNECLLTGDGQQNYTQDTSRLATQWRVLTAIQEYLSRKFALMAWIEACYVFGLRGIRLETNFGHWLLNVNAPCRCNLKQLGSDYLEFDGYLKQLHIEWGTQLDQNPACIWEEATAFTPSRFLAQTTAFTVNSLTATRTKDERSSSQHLCKISMVSSDGLYVGVLSIWPSRAYEKRVEDCPALISFEELRRFCADWIAKYEIWSVEDAQLCVANITISLNVDEVLLQMRQNLIIQHTWKVQFPVSIGSSAQLFSVLRRVYYLELSAKNTKNTEIKVKSTLVPNDFNKPLQRIWSNDARTANATWGCEVKNCSPRSSYLYWHFFSPNGRYLFFLDQHNKQRNAAVFEIIKQQGTFRLEFVSGLDRISSLGFMSFHLETRQPKVVFHPSGYLLAFSSCGSGSLWAFKSGHGLFTYSGAEVEGFTQCGRMLVRKTGSQHPDIEDLPAEVAESLRHQRSNNTPEVSQHRLSCSLTANSNNAMSLSGMNAIPQGILKGSSSIVSSTGELITTTVSHDHGRISLRQISASWGNASSRELELTKLPNWKGISDVTAAVKVPTSKEDSIKIVLNKRIRPYYDMRQSEEDRHFPAIIGRDPSSLHQAVWIESPGSSRMIEDHNNDAVKSLSTPITESTPVPVYDPPQDAHPRDRFGIFDSINSEEKPQDTIDLDDLFDFVGASTAMPVGLDDLFDEASPAAPPPLFSGKRKLSFEPGDEFHDSKRRL